MEPKITFSIDSVTFNTSCVNLFPDHQHVVFNIDVENQRLILEPCPAYDKDSLKFANLQDGKNAPCKCITKVFCALLYSMMGWNQSAKYTILAIYQEFGDKQIIVFNLDESLSLPLTAPYSAIN